MNLVIVFLLFTFVAGVGARIAMFMEPRPERIWIYWVALGTSVIASCFINTVMLGWLWYISLAAATASAVLGYQHQDVLTGIGRMLAKPRNWLILILGGLGLVVIKEWPGNPAFQEDVFTLLLLVVAICLMVGYNPAKKLKKKSD